MSLYLLDTNTVSYFLRAHPHVTRRLCAMPITSVCISVITEGELRFGTMRRPAKKRLRQSIDEFLLRVDILSWDSNAARHYAALRVALETSGKGIGALDLLIAAQAVSTGSTLVTSDKALHGVPGLAVEDWCMP